MITKTQVQIVLKDIHTIAASLKKIALNYEKTDSKESKWISVEKGYPEGLGPVLVRNQFGSIDISEGDYAFPDTKEEWAWSRPIMHSTLDYDILEWMPFESLNDL